MARTPDLVDRFSERLARLPLVKPRQVEDLPVHIDRRRIYVLPTGFGLFLSLMLVAMVLGGLNYNNNPALLLAFVTIAVAHNSLVQAHLTLSGLRLVALHAEPVFAGQSIAVRAAFEATGLRRRPGLELRAGDAESFLDMAPGERAEVTLVLATRQRGWLDVGRLRLSTIRPLGRDLAAAAHPPAGLSLPGNRPGAAARPRRRQHLAPHPPARRTAAPPARIPARRRAQTGRLETLGARRAPAGA